MQIGVNKRPRVGEAACGDDYVVLRSGALTTIAVVDGLGHGEDAARASAAFCAFTAKNQEAGLPELMRGAHEALARTRGAAAALLRVDEETHRLSYLGVGNIALVAHSEERIRPVSYPGIVGKRMAKTVQFDYDLHPDDLIAVHSDGIASALEIERFKGMEAQKAADAIAREHGKFHDDVLCLVLLY